MRGFTTVMTYPIKLLNGSANARRAGAGGRAAGGAPLRARPPTSWPRWPDRSASEGTLDSETAHLVQRSVAFGPRTAGEIMTPRVQMACVDATDPVSEVIELSSATGFSKFPVVKGTSDNVVGSVHVKQAVAVPRSERHDTLVREVMVEADRRARVAAARPAAVAAARRGLPDGDRVRRVRRHGRCGHPRGRRRGDRRRHLRRARPLRLAAAATARRGVDRLGPAASRRGRRRDRARPARGRGLRHRRRPARARARPDPGAGRPGAGAAARRRSPRTTTRSRSRSTC